MKKHPLMPWQACPNCGDSHTLTEIGGIPITMRVGELGLCGQCGVIYELQADHSFTPASELSLMRYQLEDPIAGKVLINLQSRILESQTYPLTGYPFISNEICAAHGGAFTTGFLASLNHPELIITDIPSQTCHDFFWQMYHAIKKTGLRLKHGQKLVNFTQSDHPAIILQVDPDVARLDRRLCSAQFLEEGWERFQLVPCDRLRRFPWEAGSELSDHAVLGTFDGITEVVDMTPILEEIGYC